MKKVILAAALALTASLSYGQGLVTFVTAGTGSGRVSDYNGSVIGDTGGTLGTVGLNGNQFFVQLWYGAAGSTDAASFRAASTKNGSLVSPVVNFRNGANAGYVQQSGTTSLGAVFGTAGDQLSSTVWLQDITGGAGAVVQLRAWYSLGNTVTTWADAIASQDPLMRVGSSVLVSLASTGDALGTPTPGLPVGINVPGFQLVAVPEPSTFALAGLGAAAMLIFRRRK